MTRKDQIICIILLTVLVACAAIYMLMDLSLWFQRVLGLIGILCWIFIVYLRRFKPRRSKSPDNHDDMA